MEGAVHRLRPKLLTEGTTIIGLAPMLWATGTGAEIMQPMAAPVLGGILVADEVIDCCCRCCSITSALVAGGKSTPPAQATIGTGRLCRQQGRVDGMDVGA